MGQPIVKQLMKRSQSWRSCWELQGEVFGESFQPNNGSEARQEAVAPEKWVQLLCGVQV